MTSDPTGPDAALLKEEQPKEGSKSMRVLVPLALAIVAGGYFGATQEWVTGKALWVSNSVMILTVIYLIGIGAAWLVESACRMANTLGISQVIIGLTVVAFGTSAPEGAVSLIAGFKGNGDITIANVVGSNIFNLGFILGGVALIVKGGIQTSSRLVRRDGPLLLLATLILFVFVGGLPWAKEHTGFALGPITILDLKLQRGEGIIMFSSLIIYLVFLYISRNKSYDSPATASAEELSAPVTDTVKQLTDEIPKEKATWLDIPLFLVGLAFVLIGCDFLVGSAEVVKNAAGEITGLTNVSKFGALWFADKFGVEPYVIGVTVIAAGTSAPEAAVSLIAAIKGRFDISAGNLLGSDIFNVLGVVGLAGIVIQPDLAGPTVSVSPAAIMSVLFLSVMVLMTIVFMWTGNRVSRKEGFFLLCIAVGRWIWDFYDKAGA